MKLIKEDIGELDSAGNSLSDEQVDFFKNSKVRNKQGKLMVCYHGTKKDFDTFDKSKIGSNYKGFSAWGRGFYFVSDQLKAKQWASFDSSKGIENKMFMGGYDANAKAMAVYLNIINPYIDYVTKDDELIEYVLNTNEMKEFLKNFNLNRGFIERNIIEIMTDAGLDATEILQKFGYDGVICEYNTGRVELVAYEPSQIKAITNKKPTNRDSINESTDVFYVGDTEVIQNPSDTEYRQFYSEIKKGLGARYDYRIHEPLVRYTYDDKGNYYIWNAFKSTHYGIEKEIKQRYNVRVHQGKLFDIDEED